MKKGDKVTTIKHPGLCDYCADHIGTIEQVRENDSQIEPGISYIIRFDEPTPAWGPDGCCKVPTLRLRKGMFKAV